MSYLVEMDVDEYGALVDGTESLPVDMVDHDWFTPYPLVEQELVFEWEEGDAGELPNVFHHFELQDWICDEATYDLLLRLAPGDLRLIAKARLGDLPMYVVQIMTVLDVVARDKEEEFANRIFHLPDSFIDVYVGETIKVELEAAKVKGLIFVAADPSDRA